MTAMHEFLHQATEEFQQTIDSIREQSFAQAYYLDYLWRMSVTACFRMAAVERLAGFPLAIYGDDGWIRSKSVLREQYHGLVTPGQLPELYSRHPLHLNLNFMQVASTVNPRVLDLAACGSAVITDDRSELSILFPNPEACPFSFRAMEELPDLVSDLRRRDLAEHRRQVRAAVLKEHTMLHRADWLASKLCLSRE
ncbi:MAG: glycosyltransferase [Planctomycetota bacterium]